ncbi:hypothetical protein [Mongoliibacter ruber]|uniref:Uncharacterized protein n=1 Tax=Mongoliibacter ruber TaxID=1750599 RepID=A0A2T0WV86_9BACT|nr:hypothetical protein [Mongoliibacter ruber]PRY90606.1 hypothetical protein CLW00_101270 [Mongoliibacter ruber]
MSRFKHYTYHLREDISQETYETFPEDVRKVYISTVKKIPMDEKEKMEILKKYPQFFDRRPTKSYGQNVRRLFNVKKMRDKLTSKIRTESFDSELSPDQVEKILIVDKDQVEFPKS